MAAHETFERSSHDDEPGSSNRTFGLVFTAFFLFVGLSPLRHHQAIRWWSLALAGLFLAVAAVAPVLLQPLNRLWTRFALLLQKITNPIVMSVLFYLLITPMGLLMKAFGKDPLNRKFDPDAESYWINRQPLGEQSESMRHQF